MWSKPAPPSDSGNGTPVSPSSAAFLKRSRGKCPVSSSSFARGRTSDSANSRTLFCSSLCSSVSSRSTVCNSLPAKHTLKFCILARLPGPCESGQRLGETFESSLQVLRVHPRLTRHGHKIRIANPARQRVQVQMPGNAGPCGTAQIHSKVHPVRVVFLPIRAFHDLRQLHHLRQGFRVTQIQFREDRKSVV